MEKAGNTPDRLQPPSSSLSKSRKLGVERAEGSRGEGRADAQQIGREALRQPRLPGQVEQPCLSHGPPRKLAEENRESNPPGTVSQPHQI